MFSRLFIYRFRRKAQTPENRLNENFTKKEFQELWNRINHKYAYTVNFESKELIEKAIAVCIILAILGNLVDEEKGEALDATMEEGTFFSAVRLDGFPYLDVAMGMNPVLKMCPDKTIEKKVVREEGMLSTFDLHTAAQTLLESRIKERKKGGIRIRGVTIRKECYTTPYKEL